MNKILFGDRIILAGMSFYSYFLLIICALLALIIVPLIYLVHPKLMDKLSTKFRKII